MGFGTVDDSVLERGGDNLWLVGEQRVYRAARGPFAKRPILSVPVHFTTRREVQQHHLGRGILTLGASTFFFVPLTHG